MGSFIKYNWLSVLWAIFICYMCLVPSKTLPKVEISNIDKAVHFTFYFILVVLMYWGWKKQDSFQGLYTNTFIKVFIIACFYGISIEVMQGVFTADRHFELLDEAANASGAAAGGLFAVKIVKRTLVLL